MGVWVQKLQLAADDPVFAGAEALRMCKMLGRECDPAVVTASLREQAGLALKLERQGRLDEALEVASDLSLESFGDAGRSVLTSPNLRVAVQVLNAFAPLLNVRHHLTLTFRGEDAVLGLQDFIPMAPDDRRILLLLDEAKIARFLADMFDLPRWPLRHSGGQVLVPGHLASRKLPGFSHIAGRRFQRSCQRRMRELENAALRESVRRLLLKFGDAVPSLADAAAQLHLSTRTFRRRLAEQGKTYMQILDEVRYMLALRYLTTSEMTTEVIAQQLGYSESANFRHAFRRWTGSSPRRFSRMASIVPRDSGDAADSPRWKAV